MQKPCCLPIVRSCVRVVSSLISNQISSHKDAGWPPALGNIPHTSMYERVREKFPTKHPLCLFAVVMKNMQQVRGVNSVWLILRHVLFDVRSAKYLWLSATAWMDILAKCSFLYVSISLSAASNGVGVVSRLYYWASSLMNSLSLLYILFSYHLNSNFYFFLKLLR